MKIYVGNLPRTVTEESLKKTFDQYGTTTSIKIIIDKLTNQPRGFAFIDMPNDDEANLAIVQLNGFSFEGRPLVVNQARPQEPRDRDGRSGGQGGGYSSRPRSNGTGSSGSSRPYGSSSSKGPRSSTRSTSWNSR